MKRLLLSAVVLLASTAAHAADMAGTWDVDGAVYGNPVKYSCAFTQDGDALTGTAHLGDKDYAVTGSTKDKAATWQFEVEYNGAPLTIVFNGTLTSDTAIAGKIAVAGVEGEFTGTKK